MIHYSHRRKLHCRFGLMPCPLSFPEKQLNTTKGKTYPILFVFSTLNINGFTERKKNRTNIVRELSKHGGSDVGKQGKRERKTKKLILWNCSVIYLSFVFIMFHLLSNSFRQEYQLNRYVYVLQLEHSTSSHSMLTALFFPRDNDGKINKIIPMCQTGGSSLGRKYKSILWTLRTWYRIEHNKLSLFFIMFLTQSPPSRRTMSADNAIQWKLLLLWWWSVILIASL